MPRGKQKIYISFYFKATKKEGEKMKRIFKITCLLLSLVTVLSTLSVYVFAEDLSGSCGEKLTWTFDSEGTLTIDGTGEMENFWTPPWYDQRRSVKKVIINEGVTSIGEFAFVYCLSLKEVSIPSTVKTINFGAFKGCELLETITLAKNPVFEMKNGCLINPKEKKLVVGTTKGVIPTDGSVTIIGDYAFQYRYFIKEIYIPESVTRIGYGAFECCGALENVVFEESEKVVEITIDDYAFNLCSKLKSIKLPKNVKSIGYYAFNTSDFTIIGYSNSTAEKYAVENNISFLNLDTLPKETDTTYLDESSFTMPNVKPDTTAKDVISSLEKCTVLATIADKDGNSLADDDRVGTGCVVETILGDYTIVINGDLDGSGTITTTDYFQVKSSLVGNTTLEGAFLYAADTDRNGTVNSVDYIQIKSYLVGNIDLFD